MPAAELIAATARGSIMLMIFAVALSTTLSDLAHFVRRPGLLVRSLVSMNVVMPLFAVLIAGTVDIDQVVKYVLVAMAVSPLPPILPRKELRAGGTSAYAMSLIAATALFSIVFVPLVVEFLGRTFDVAAHVSALNVAKIVAATVLIPVLAGVLVRRAAPSLAERLAKPLSTLALVVLVLALLPILLAKWPQVVALLDPLALGIIAFFAAAGLAVGHLLGGPNRNDRTVLALSTATRHPAVALAALSGLAEHEVALAAVLLVVLVSSAISLPYVMCGARRTASAKPG